MVWIALHVGTGSSTASECHRLGLNVFYGLLAEQNSAPGCVAPWLQSDPALGASLNSMIEPVN